MTLNIDLTIDCEKLKDFVYEIIKNIEELKRADEITSRKLIEVTIDDLRSIYNNIEYYVYIDYC
jgi:hypothetical protein